MPGGSLRLAGGGLRVVGRNVRLVGGGLRWVGKICHVVDGTRLVLLEAKRSKRRSGSIIVIHNKFHLNKELL